MHQLPNGPDEIIVVDGADSERCHEICNQYSAHWLASEPCRGEQLRVGAALAKSEVLWFLHADARFSKNSLVAMTSALEQGAVGGYFRFRFDVPRAWPALILEPAIALRCRYGVPYGDQGIFVLRHVYKKAGGHGPWPLFEEVPLVRRVRRFGHSPEDAKDLTQGFFARLLAKDSLHSADREKGRFRTFLMVALKRYLANEWHRGQAAKRGGGLEPVPLDTQLAERLYGGSGAHSLTPEQLFDKRWALTLIETALARMEHEYRLAPDS